MYIAFFFFFTYRATAREQCVIFFSWCQQKWNPWIKGVTTAIQVFFESESRNKYSTFSWTVSNVLYPLLWDIRVGIKFPTWQPYESPVGKNYLMQSYQTQGLRLRTQPEFELGTGPNPKHMPNLSFWVLQISIPNFTCLLGQFSASAHWYKHTRPTSWAVRITFGIYSGINGATQLWDQPIWSLHSNPNMILPWPTW